MNRSLILSLVAFNTNLQLAHWQADTALNTHRTLGDLYEAMTGLTDQLAELMMGKEGNTAFPAETIELTPNADLKELLTSGLEVLRAMRGELKAGPDDDALNVVADMSAQINRAKYLLKK